VIPVHQKHLTEQTNIQVKQYLNRGDNLLYFVEGTRGSGRELLPFRMGAFKEAARTGLPILPMYILGSEQRLCKKNTLCSVKSGKIVVILDNPVYFTLNDLEKQVEDFEAMYRSKHEEYYIAYETYSVTSNRSSFNLSNNLKRI
jgi:1-acyl-sn-glycerol-3-phosphate acyltransferase